MADAVALLDANVLVPIALTDLLLEAAEAGLYAPRWSAAVHDEWMRTVLRLRPDLTADRVDRRRREMDRQFPEALVGGYEPLVAGLGLPDPDDRHVLAAAIHAKATVIVTFNLADFPAEILAPYRMATAHPDVFVVGLFDGASAAASRVFRTVAGRWSRGGESPAGMFSRLGMPRTTALILAGGL